MSNKKIFKKLYSKKINKKDNYKKILEYIEGNDIKSKNNIFKFSLVPTCLIIVICGFLIFDKNNKMAFKPDNSMTNYLDTNKFSINSVTTLSGISKLDADVRIENYYMIPYFDFLTDLNIPNDFDSKENFKSIYVKSNFNSDDYDLLNNYELWLKNTTNNRKIKIAFSSTYKPLRDYFFNEKDSEISKINGVELKIHKYENTYMTSFTYNNINFDIETNDITETEFIDLLVSIIK